MSNKSDLLGIPHGTAAHRLRKSIMFNMAQRLGEDVCFRCGKQIATEKDFSIEHKEAWERSPNPLQSFLDLRNISFSHHACNVGAGLRHRRIISIQEVRKLEWQKRKPTQGWKDTVAKRREKRRQARLDNGSVV